MRKNSNFRSTGSVQKSTVNGASAANSLTTLERTHIYNVDKKQVAIIDVGGGNGGSSVEKKIEQIVGSLPEAAITTPTTTAAPPLSLNNIVDNVTIDEKSNPITNTTTTTSGAVLDSNLNVNTNNLASMESLNDCIPTVVPPSPRGFDPKIKRPQIPAPPPPTNRPKSGELASTDSTNL